MKDPKHPLSILTKCSYIYFTVSLKKSCSGHIYAARLIKDWIDFIYIYIFNPPLNIKYIIKYIIYIVYLIKY